MFIPEKDCLSNEVLALSDWPATHRGGASLFRFSRKDEGLDDQDPGGPGFSFADHGFCGHVFRITHGLPFYITKWFDFAGHLV